MNVMLLAAGLGTRLRPYTNEVPKPAIPFMSVPLACYPLSLLEKINISNLVVNLHHLPEKVRHTLLNIHWPVKNLCFTDEIKAPLGSGGAIRNAEDYLKGDGQFIYANADEVILPHSVWSAKELIDYHHWHKGIATILCMRHPDVGSKFGGIWVDPENNRVVAVAKAPQPNLKGLHFVGIILFSDKIFNYFTKANDDEENIFYDTLKNAMNHGECAYALEIEAEWFETGNTDDFIQATKTCCENLEKNPKPQWAENLAQIIRLHSNNQYVVEKSNPDLLGQLQSCVKNIKSE